MSIPETRVTNSALWAAAGDAAGFITELVGAPGVKARIGKVFVDKTYAWRKALNFRQPYVEADLPAGTYSDDTQLRLAVGRAIQSTGRFDVEAFSKIELPVWLSYSLGAGKATKAAAANLSRRDVSWWSNFFDSRGTRYVDAGGNGAAMRIQPHVWASPKNWSTRDLLKNVIRDSLVTHGHPMAFFGSIFHALALREALLTGQISHPSDWHGYIDQFSLFEEIVSSDSQLGAIWIGLWEKAAGTSLKKELSRARDAAYKLVGIALDSSKMSNANYSAFLQQIGGVDPSTRGSGVVSALAASYLAWAGRRQSVEGAVLVAANALGSDTDSIASMAGAILGCTTESSPQWQIQDAAYIVEQATRLSRIASGVPVESFSYPVLGLFTPPTSQSDAVGLSDGSLALVGLGLGEAEGPVYEADKAEWQWVKLWFGQTVLAKRRAGALPPLPIEQLPRPPRTTLTPRNHQAAVPEAGKQASLTFSQEPSYGRLYDEAEKVSKSNPRRSIDHLTDEAIRADFADLTLGKLLNELLDTHGTVDAAIAFAAVVAKAKIARKKRSAK